MINLSGHTCRGGAAFPTQNNHGQWFLVCKDKPQVHLNLAVPLKKEVQVTCLKMEKMIVTVAFSKTGGRITSAHPTPVFFTSTHLTSSRVAPASVTFSLSSHCLNPHLSHLHIFTSYIRMFPQTLSPKAKQQSRQAGFRLVGFDFFWVESRESETQEEIGHRIL